MRGKRFVATVLILTAFFCISTGLQARAQDTRDEIVVEVKTRLFGTKSYSAGVRKFCPVPSATRYYSPYSADRPVVCRENDYIYLRPIGTSSARCSGYYVVKCNRLVSNYQNLEIPFEKGADDKSMAFRIRVTDPKPYYEKLSITVNVYFDDDSE